MHDSASDAELVARVRGGDVHAYGELVTRHQGSAVRLAALITRDSTEAEDVAQEAFIKAYYALDRFKPDASFRAWLVRIVVNQARNARSAAQRRSTLPVRVGDERPRETTSRSAEESAVANELRSALLIAIDELRDDDREVLAYRYLLDLSEAEMAQALSCPPGTVKSRLSRSLGRLRENLRRAAPLLVIPDLDVLLARDLPDVVGSAVEATSRPDMGAAVVQHVVAAGALASTSAAAGRPSMQQLALAATGGGILILAVVAAGLLLSMPQRATQTPVAPLVSRPTAIASPMAAPAPIVAPTPTVAPVPISLAVYGEDLTAEQRAELRQLLGADNVADATVSRAELIGALQSAGLPLEGSERAISSVLITCQPAGGGLRVRTHNITDIPAAAYANALISAGIADASVVVAAPSGTLMSGETALVGVLRAYPTCHPGEALEPDRERLAYDHLGVTARLAAATGAWDRAAAAVLRVTQQVVSARTTDEASIAAALDQELATEGLPVEPGWRAEAVSVLTRLARVEHRAYGRGFDVQQLAPNEVVVQVTHTP